MKRDIGIGLVAGIIIGLAIQTTKNAEAQNPTVSKQAGNKAWKVIEAMKIKTPDSQSSCMIRGFLDPNTNCYIFVTENGSITAVAAPAK